MMMHDDDDDNDDEEQRKIDDDSVYIEEDTEEFSSFDRASKASSGSSDDGIAVLPTSASPATYNNNSNNATAESALIQLLAKHWPFAIPQRLLNCSNTSMERCLLITMTILGLVVVLGGILSVTVGGVSGSSSSAASTSVHPANNNATDIVSAAPSVFVVKTTTTAVPSNMPLQEQQNAPTISVVDFIQNRPTSAPLFMEHSTMTDDDDDDDDEVEVVVPTAAPISVTDLVFEGEPTIRPSHQPSSAAPSTAPYTPTWKPRPTSAPTMETLGPTPFKVPTSDPFRVPTSNPATERTREPTWRPSSAPSNPMTYFPGNLTHMEHGLLLSEGLRARLIATSGLPIQYRNGVNSSRVFHGRPDAGATFAEVRATNEGGWVYVSNSEMRGQDPPGGMGNGGVGAITFDRDGAAINYEMLLENTTWNCGGGKTPWNTWVSCEEAPGTGQLYQVSPFGLRDSEILTLGKDGGRFESFAYDISDKDDPYYYVTEDHEKGALQRFSPRQNMSNWSDPWADPWSMLHGDGEIKYLILKPTRNSKSGGTFRWSTNREAARVNARRLYPHSEGIDTHNGHLFFVSKKFRQLYELDLEKLTYTNSTTRAGLFDGAPDQIVRIMKTQQQQDEADDNEPNENDDSSGASERPMENILYFTEENGKDAGVHGRGKNGKFFSILESPIYQDEVTGLAFSPDNMHMYFAYQVDGVVFDVYREDGYPFHATALDIKYHEK